MALFILLAAAGIAAPDPVPSLQEHVSVILELAETPVAAAYAAPGPDKHSAAKRRLHAIEAAQARVLAQLSPKSPETQVLYRVQRTYNGIAVRLPADRAASLQAIPGVRRVRRLQRVTLDNTSSVPFIGAPALWDGAGRGLTGRGISIGIIDSGIEYTHPDFGGIPGMSFPTGKVAGGYDFAGDTYNSVDPNHDIPAPDPDPMDQNGHGTHVAGTAAGLGLDAGGNPYAGAYGPETPFAAMQIGPGVAPEASLYALKIFGPEGESELVIPAVEWAVDPNGDGDPSDHLDVINLSLGEAFAPADSPEAEACDNAAALGVLVVASAGNSHDAFFSTGTPASAPRVISVAASEDLDPALPQLSADRQAGFSSRGPGVTGAGRVLLKPDISAPGQLILSAAAEATNFPTLYRYASGTSMAAPHIAGAMALLRQAHPGWSAEELKAVLMNTAADVFSQADYGLPREAPSRAGAGRVRVDAAAAQEVIAFNRDREGVVGVTFETMEVLGAADERRTVRVMNKGAAPAAFTVALDPRAEIPGVSLRLEPENTGIIAPGGFAEITLLLHADADAMQHTHDPAIAEFFAENMRSWVSEASGFVLFTPPDGGETLRVPYYAALRPASAIRSFTHVLDARDTAAPRLLLAGQDLHTSGLLPFREEALGGVYELVDVSPDETASTGLADAGDFRYIGVASDYPDCLAAGGAFEDTTIYIAIATQGNWQSPHWVRFYVYFDVDGDEVSDYRLRNSFVRGPNGEGSVFPDVFVSRLSDFQDVDLVEGPLNGFTADERDTVPFFSNVMVLPVRAKDLGLTDTHSSFSFRLESVLLNDPLVVVDQAPAEVTPTVKRRIAFDAKRPAVDVRDGVPGAPMFTEWAGSELAVHFNSDAYGQSGLLDCDDFSGECVPSGGLGVLLLHHHNMSGAKAQWLPVLTAGDSDADGIPDRVEDTRDSDADGIPDLVDRDADGDGIADIVESAEDGDGDGVPNYRDLDSDGDTLPDSVENRWDFDFDGIPNFLDPDSDGDGLPDRVEVQVLGTNPFDPDTDRDGIPDNTEEPGDLDGDGWMNAADPDSDGDGILDAVEGTEDPDDDGIPNCLDLDSDADSIPDAVEGLGDPDRDQTPNCLDLDSDGDGIPDAVEGVADSDGDSKPDYLDLDSDDDLLTDEMEGTSDPDDDGLPNFLDPDSDGDSLPDKSELTRDPDRDEIPSYLDSDSDNDGVGDQIEATQWHTNPYHGDSDRDDIPDAVEGDRDSDLDGVIDALDEDADEDGLPDVFETAEDLDGDGTPNFLDEDADGDELPDLLEGAIDSDGDGAVDAYDTDADDDGIPDLLEGAADSDHDSTPDYLDTDADADGIPDLVEGAGDADADGAANYRDLDSDGDGIPDSLEGGSDFDGDTAPDYLGPDADADAIPDLLEGIGDPDGDGMPNFRDPDSDGDGLPDLAEGLADPDNDGVSNFLDLDADDDGLEDQEEVELYFTNPYATDSDYDGRPDPEEIAAGSNAAQADPPAAPQDLAASDGTFADRIHVTWAALPGAVEYQVYRLELGTGETAAPLGDWQTSAVFEDLTALAVRETPGHGCQGPLKTPLRYSYRVQARIAPPDAAPTAPGPASAPDEGYRAE